MEIPELNIIISDLAPGISSLHNPSLFSSEISTPPKLPQHLHGFWKWGALIFTLIATFRAIITRTKLLFLRFCTDKFLSPKHPPTQHLYYDSDTNSSSSDSSASSEDYQDQDHDPMTPFQQPTNENTKPWVFSGLGLGFGYEEVNSGNVVAIWDVNRCQRLHSFLPAVFLSSAGMNNEGNVLLGGPWASGNGCAIDSVNVRSAQASPAKWTACIVKPNVFCGSAHYATYLTLAGVILSSRVNRKGNVLLSGYDRRMGREIPVICAEWRWRQMGRVVVFNYGEKVYVRDDATGGALMVVGDIRNAKTPLLEDRTGCDGDAWLDVDAVSFWDEFVDS